MLVPHAGGGSAVRGRLACDMEAAFAMNRHVHRRPDGLVVICTRRRCALWQHRNIVWRVLLVTAPLLIAASSTLVAKNLGVILALVAVAALLVWRTREAASRIERDARASSPFEMKSRASARIASPNRS